MARRNVLSMMQQMQIRDMDAGELPSPTKIKGSTGYSYPTIRKCLAKDGFFPRRSVKKAES